MARRTPLSKLCDLSPYRRICIGEFLGYVPTSWRMICSGSRRLPIDKCHLFAKLLGVKPRVVELAARRSYRGTKPK